MLEAYCVVGSKKSIKLWYRVSQNPCSISCYIPSEPVGSGIWDTCNIHIKFCCTDIWFRAGAIKTDGNSKPAYYVGLPVSVSFDCFLPLIKCIQCLFMMTLNHTVCSIILICKVNQFWLWIMEQSVSLQWQQLLATMLMTNIYIYFRAFSLSNMLWRVVNCTT